MPSESEILDLMKKIKTESEEKFQKYVDFYKEKYPDFYEKIKKEFKLNESFEAPQTQEKSIIKDNEAPVLGESIVQEEDVSKVDKVLGDKPVVQENKELKEVGKSSLDGSVSKPVVQENKDQLDINVKNEIKSPTSSVEVSDFLEQKKKEINPNEAKFNELNQEVKKGTLETKIENSPKEEAVPPVEKPKKKQKLGIIIAIVAGGIIITIVSLFLFGIL